MGLHDSVPVEYEQYTSHFEKMLFNTNEDLQEFQKTKTYS